MLSTLQAVTRGISGLAASALTQARLNAQYKAEAADEIDAGSSSGDDGPRVTIGAPAPPKPAAAPERDADPEHIAEADAADQEAMAAVAAAAAESNKAAAGASAGAPSTGRAPREIPFPELDPSEARIAMSACLLGHEVRYNKGHCHARSTTNLLGTVFKFVPVCPEIDIGLGTPRPTLRIVGDGRNLQRGHEPDMEDLSKIARLYCPTTDEDLTEKMVTYAKAKVEDLRGYGCDGFVLKKDSPSCGLDRVKIYQSTAENAPGRSIYKGFFARTLVSEWPELPVTDEGRLQDEDARDNFIRQVICHHRWRLLDDSFGAVVKFHESHKFVLLAQDPNTLKELGRMLAKGKAHFAENNLRPVYYRKFFMALKVLVGRGRHVNVLRRICGYVKPNADAELYASLQGAIDDYNDGLVPLVVPLTLLQVMSRSLPTSAEEGATTDDAAATKALLTASEYIKGAPRSLKAHTAISSRTKTTVPVVVKTAGI
uniref:DUF1722 domain-containing protein n=1 Tax=Neobodo designis TaxID=312471 RepID=A0A7S1MSI6_NEODS